MRAFRLSQHQDQPCLSSSIFRNAKPANVGIRNLSIVFISIPLRPPFSSFPCIKRSLFPRVICPAYTGASSTTTAFSSSTQISAIYLFHFPKIFAMVLPTKPSGLLSSTALSLEACLACSASSPLKTLPAPYNYALATAMIATGARRSMSSLVS